MFSGPIRHERRLPSNNSCLEEYSRKKMFNPLGCYKYLRMPFGLPNAPETFQHCIEENFGKPKGVTVFFIQC